MTPGSGSNILELLQRVDLTDAIDYDAPLGKGLVACIVPAAINSSRQLIDLCAGRVSPGYNLTRAANAVTGAHHVYNGSSSYADFGTSSRYAIASGGITIATCYRTTGWGQNCTISSRRFLTGPSDYINWAIQEDNTSAPRKLTIFHTKAAGSYVGIRTDQTHADMGGTTGKEVWLVCSWNFGALTTSAIMTLNGVPFTYTTVTGTDGNHTTHPSQRMGMGADYSSSWSLFANASIGLQMIWRRRLPLVQHRQLNAPDTRFSMLKLVRDAAYAFNVEAASSTTAAAYYRNHILSRRSA